MKLPDESSPDGRPCEPDDPCRLPLQRLEVELTELAAHINAATCRWLSLVAEFDRRDGWAKWGCKSCAAWLSWRCGLGPAAAREQLRVARRLAELPTAIVAGVAAHVELDTAEPAGAQVAATIARPASSIGMATP